LRKASIRFIMSGRLFVRMEKLGTHWTDFHETWYLRVFRKSIEIIQVSSKSEENNGYFTWRPIYIFIISRSVLLRVRNFSDKSCRENQNTHFIFINSPHPLPTRRKSCRLWDNVEKFRRAWQAIWQYGTCALHAGYPRLQTHTQNTQYLLHFHCNHGCMNAPQC
jgi:hypothetical protein